MTSPASHRVTRRKFSENSYSQTWNAIGRTLARPLPQLTAQEAAAIRQFAGKDVGRQVIDPQSNFEQAMKKRMVPLLLETFDSCGIPH